MLADVLDALDVPKDFVSTLAGCSPRQLDEWLAGQRQVPLSAARRISTAIGIPVEAITAQTRTSTEPQDLPPMWLKAREQDLGDPGLRALAITRLLVSKYDEALSLLEEPPGEFRQLLNDIRGRVDVQAPAEKQGQVAADAFLKLTGLGQGARGIGEVFRGALRARGLLVIETPINDKTLEGFCIPVGTATHVRPCLLANSFTTTWFRRNEVLLHELAHAIFDLEGSFAVFDVSERSSKGVTARIAEERANSFALHALLPERLLKALEAGGVDFAGLNAKGMARVIAQSHAEQRLIVRAALRYGMVSQEQSERLRALNVSSKELSSATYHARGLASIETQELHDPRVRDWESRKTTFPIAGVRLPIPFVDVVLRALGEKKLTTAKAAELLMVTPEELSARYGVEDEDDQG